MPWRDSIGVTGDRRYATKFADNTPKPVRVQRSRQEKQSSPNGLEIKYCGRPTKWGNPFRVEQMRLNVLKFIQRIWIFQN